MDEARVHQGLPEDLLAARRHEVRSFVEACWAPAVGEVWRVVDVVPEPVAPGRLVAVVEVLVHPAGVARRDLAVVEDGALRPLLPPCASGGRSAPAWHPEGGVLAFLTDEDEPGVQQVRLVRTVPGPHDPAPAVVTVGDVDGTVDSAAWTPDGRALLAVVAGRGAQVAGAMGSGRVPLPRDPTRPSWFPEVRVPRRPGDWRRLWRLGEATPPEPVSPSALNVWEAAPAGPDEVVAVVSDTPDEDAWYGARLVRLSLVTGTERPVHADDRQVGAPAASPSGVTVAGVSAVCSDRTLVAGRVVVSAHEVTWWPDTLGVDVTHLELPDDRVLRCTGQRGLDTVQLEVDLVARTTTEVVVSDDAVGLREPRMRGGAAGIVGVREGCTGPSTVVGVDREPGGGAGTLTPLVEVRLPGHTLAAASFGRLERVTWTVADGTTIEGLVTLPAGDGPFPTVLFVHGGPVTAYRPAWSMGRPLLPFLVQRGVAVLWPNPRGSSGRGFAFADAVHGDMGGADALDLLAGVDALVARGLADPDRLAVMGGSYGAYMACRLVTMTDRFRAAIAFGPVSNWISQHFTSNIGQWDARFLSDPMDAPAGQYVTRSPVFAASSVRAAVLLEAGLLDRCTPADQAVQFFEAVVEHGGTAELVLYPEVAHANPSGDGMIDWHARQLAWLDTFLLGGG